MTVLFHPSFDAKLDGKRVGFQSAGSAPTDGAFPEREKTCGGSGSQPDSGAPTAASLPNGICDSRSESVLLDVALAEKVRAIRERASDSERNTA